MSDTPETDAAWAAWPYAGPGVHANFARKLEREREELRAEATNYLQELAHKDIAVKELRAEVERLKAACEKEFESVQQLNDEVERLKAEAELYAGWSKWEDGIWRISHQDSGPSAEWIAEDIEGLKADIDAAMKGVE